MRKILQYICLATFAIVAFVQSATSQTSTNAAISGVVTDKDGVGLPGAAVIAVHVPSGTQYAMATREDGRYSFPAVRTGGPYTVTFSFIGYNKTTIENIYLSLGQTEDLNVQMISSDVSLQEVVITGEADNTFNSKRTGAETTIKNSQITSLPSINRSITDVARLTPQSNGSSFAGRNNLYNNLSIDGSVFNNVFGLASQPGGQTNAQPISLDAIEQVQISLAPYDVRQSGFTGAGINAITRSGTNKIEGSVYTYWRNQNMISKKVADMTVARDNFEQRQMGFRIGGPIIKNKLFFFLNAEIERRTDPAHNYLAARDGVSGDNVSTVSADSLDYLKNFLLTKYGYDAGEYENYDMKTYNDKFLVRLDYNISQKHKFSIRYNYLKSWKDNNPSSSNPSNSRNNNKSTLLFSNTMYRQYNNINSIVGELNSVFSNKVSNNFIIGYSAFRDYRETPSTSFPMVDILYGSGNTTTLTSFGQEQFSVNNKLNTDIFQVSDNFNVYLGSHVLTVGAALEMFKFKNGYMRQFNSFYRFASLSDFYNNKTPYAFQYQYSAIEGDATPMAELKSAQFGVYLQDEWAVSKRIKITYGLRVDMPFYPSSLDKNPALDNLDFLNVDQTEKLDVSVLPKTTPLFSPRLGFNIDVFGDRKTQIRGGVGIFTGRVPFVWISNQASNNGLLWKRIESTTNVLFNPDPYYYSKNNSNLNLNPTYELNVTAKNFKFPQVFRTNIAIDQKLPYGIVFSLEGIYTKDLNAVYHRNDNLPAATETLPDGRPLFPAASSRINQNITAAYVLDNSSEGYSYFITAQLSKEFNFGLSAMVAYTYSKTEDLSSNPGSTASSAFQGNYISGNPNSPVLGYSNYDVPHKIVANLNYKINYGKMFSSALSIIYVGCTGDRYSYTYDGDINRDGVSGNDLIYIPKDISEIALIPEKNHYSATIVSAEQNIQAQWNELNAYIEQDEYLSKHRGEIVPRNHSLGEWVNTIDLRFAQDIYVNVKGQKNTLEFTLDIINLGNLLNSDWGVRKVVNKTKFITASYNKTTKVLENTFPYLNATTKTPLTSTYSNYTGLSSRWQIQLGLRYIFN